MAIPPVPQFPAQHPRAPFCQITCGVDVGVGLDGVLLPQDQTEVAVVTKRTATIPDIRNFILFSLWEITLPLSSNRFKHSVDERDAAHATRVAEVVLLNIHNN